MSCVAIALSWALSLGAAHAGEWISDAHACAAWIDAPGPAHAITWSGDCEGGHLQGPGVLEETTSAGLWLRTEGNFVDGRVVGRAKFTWPGGNRYDGDTVLGQRSGRGVFLWTNGTRYEGEFVANQRTGHGTLTFPDGRRYDGAFLNGKYSGPGSLYASDGSVMIAQFVDGLPAGRGTLSWDGKGAGPKASSADTAGPGIAAASREPVGDARDTPPPGAPANAPPGITRTSTTPPPSTHRDLGPSGAAPGPGAAPVAGVTHCINVSDVKQTIAFPADALRAGVYSGSAEASFEVTGGEVSSVRVTGSAGFFATTVFDAVRRLKCPIDGRYAWRMDFKTD
jgi:hypothetical protein